MLEKVRTFFTQNLANVLPDRKICSQSATRILGDGKPSLIETLKSDGRGLNNNTKSENT